ncbi:hypothetical protein V6N11_076576 [Hibiscus sabdariffa]|uniref:ATPase AAA-type core domain-containing protein n=1 Tax=Hibiscus sabdariffa TaxID=183260 RepID=A0ABR2Q6N8_9ROSI
MSRPCYVMLQIMVSWWLELDLSVMVVIDLCSMHQVHTMNKCKLWGKETICKLLLDIANKSILVIEDIDCIVNLVDHPWVSGLYTGLLNFIDGLWSICRDERIILLTTNHNDQLDLALLCPRKNGLAY